MIDSEKKWDNEVLIFDLSKRVVIHGDETDETPFATLTDTTITWKTDEMGGTGSFSRVNLNGREVLHAFAHTCTNYYDKCTKSGPRF